MLQSWRRMSLTELVSPNKSLSPLWVKEKDFWSSNLSVDQWIFLMWELWEKKCFCCRDVKAGFDQMFCPLPAWARWKNFNHPVTASSLPFSSSWNRDSNRHLCQKHLKRNTTIFNTFVLGNILFAELLHFPYWPLRSISWVLSCLEIFGGCYFLRWVCS